MNNIDRTLTALAVRQHGLVTRIQARYFGLSRRQIAARLEQGQWIRVRRGVYRMAGAAPTWQSDTLAAVLAAPDTAHASHLSAAHLHGLVDRAPPVPHLTVGRGRSTHMSDAVVHVVRRCPADIETVDRIPTTIVSRTVIDCAGILAPAQLQALVDRAMHRRLLDPSEVGLRWDKARLKPGRAGEVNLRAALEPWVGAIEAGSPPEVRLRRMIRQWGYPEPQPQVVVRSADGRFLGRVDLGWREQRIGLEYDSAEFHGPSRWWHDELRHGRIEDAGWTLLHVDKSDLVPGQRALRDALDRAWRRAAA